MVGKKRPAGKKTESPIKSPEVQEQNILRF
jgi:hypothetical protein